MGSILTQAIKYYSMSMPRPNNKPSMFCYDSGKRTYRFAARRMIAGDELK